MSAGPKAGGFVPGIGTAAAAYHQMGHTLQAEQVYLPAQQASRKLPDIQRNLAIDHALLLEAEQRQVASVAARKEAVRIEESHRHRTNLHSALVVSLLIREASV